MSILIIKTFWNKGITKEKKQVLYKILLDLQIMIEEALSVEDDEQFESKVASMLAGVDCKFASLGDEEYWGNKYLRLLEIERMKERRKKRMSGRPEDK